MSTLVLIRMPARTLYNCMTRATFVRQQLAALHDESNLRQTTVGRTACEEEANTAEADRGTCTACVSMASREQVADWMCTPLGRGMLPWRFDTLGCRLEAHLGGAVCCRGGSIH